MRFLVTCLVVLHHCFLIAESFDSPFNAISGAPITEITIVGERCSGTNYLEGLLRANFPQIRYAPYKYAWKHFYPWLDLSTFGFPPVTELPQFPELKTSKNCLFIYIVRNPLDWIKSFYANPYHVDHSLYGQGMTHFLTGSWAVTHHPCPDDWNPYSGSPFKNVLELRKFKILNSLKMGQVVDNFIVIRYETLVSSPELFIKALVSTFQLDDNGFVPFGSNHTQKKYPLLDWVARQHFFDGVDWETEKLVGYLQETFQSAR